MSAALELLPFLRIERIERIERRAPATGPHMSHGDARVDRLHLDDGVVARAAAGDPEAFRTLFLRHKSDVARLVYRMLNAPGDLEDVVQEVFVQVFRSLKDFRGQAKFSTWLFTIANNLASNHLRSKGRNPVLPVGGDGGINPASSASGVHALRPAEERALSRDGTPSAQMRKVELSDVVREALDILGEDQKMAVLLNKFEDMSYAEIADVMGRSEPAVKSLLARARTHLREQLEPYLKTGQRAP